MEDQADPVKKAIKERRERLVGKEDQEQMDHEVQGAQEVKRV